MWVRRRFDSYPGSHAVSMAGLVAARPAVDLVGT